MSLTNVIVTGDDFEKTLQISAVLEDFLADQGFTDVKRLSAVGDSYRNEVPSLLEHVRQNNPQFLMQPLRIHPLRLQDGADIILEDTGVSTAFRSYKEVSPSIIVEINEPGGMAGLAELLPHSVIVTDE